MKKISLFIVLLVCMTSCHIVTKEEPVLPEEDAYEAYGQLYIPSSGFTKENVRVKTVFKDNSRIDLYMFDVKFANAMPVTIDMLISDITYVAYDKTADTFYFSCDSVVPTAGGKPYEKYIIRQMEGKITPDSIILSNYYGQTPSQYHGLRTK